MTDPDPTHTLGAALADPDRAPARGRAVGPGISEPRRLAAARAVIDLALTESSAREAAERAARLAARTMSADLALLTLVDAADVVFVGIWPPECGLTVGERWTLGTTPCGVVVELDDAIVVEDIANEPRLRDMEMVTRYRMRSGVAVPVRIGGDAVGVLSVVQHEPRAWPGTAAATLDDLAAGFVTEVELRATLRREHSFAALAAHHPDTLCRVGPDLRYRFANGHFGALLGLRPEAMVGREVDATFPDEAQRATWLADLRRTLGGAPGFSRAYEVPTAEGTRTIDVQFVPERDEDDRVASVLVVGRDVTARLEAEHRLRDSEALLRAILHQAIVGIFMVQDGRFLYANPQLARMFGYERPDELLALPSANGLLAPESREQVAALLAAPERVTGADGHFFFTGLRRDGARLDVEAHTAMADVNGRPAMVGMVRDVTERNALELQLRQAQKMEAVGQLAAGVAHDFNNLLAAIVANAHLALDDLEQGQPAAPEDLRGILDAADRAAALTRRLLAFGRHEPVRPETVDLGRVIGGMEGLLRRVLPSSCHLAVLTAGPPLLVVADRAQLEQVVMNLVVNARDALPHGGTVTVETLRDEHPTLGPAAALVVTDDGEGMDARTVERIFEPFFTTKERGRGTGLGLTTVHATVDQAGGAVAVESAPGRGTTFRLHFPLASEEAVERRTPPRGMRARSSGAAMGDAPPVVLLAEDEEAVRRTSKRMLERAGYHVMAARHGADALRMLEVVDRAVDVLVSDISMPELDGVSLATRARERQPDLAVVLMSGYTDILTDETLRALDAEFVPKPFSAEELLAAVAAVLGRRAGR